MAPSKRFAFQCLACKRNQIRGLGRAGNYATCQYCGVRNPGPAMIAILVKTERPAENSAENAAPASKAQARRAAESVSAPRPELPPLTPPVTAAEPPSSETPPRRPHFLYRPVFGKKSK